MTALPLIFALMFEPAYFKIDVETNTDVAIFVNGKQVQAGVVYKTERMSIPQTVEVEIRYVHGDQVVKETTYMDLTPGKIACYKVKLIAEPPWIFKC